MKYIYVMISKEPYSEFNALYSWKKKKKHWRTLLNMLFNVFFLNKPNIYMENVFKIIPQNSK